MCTAQTMQQKSAHTIKDGAIRTCIKHPATATDEYLMQLYCNGDYTAFEVLYHRHSRSLYRFISWQSPRTDWVDEITQDAWLRLHNSRATYIPQASPKTLLYQIARNRLIDILRQQHATLSSDLINSEDNNELILDKISDNMASNVPPDFELMQSQRQQQLHDAIRQLPIAQKEALVLQYFSELSINEIAELTGEKTETIKGRIRYAMQKLKQIYGYEV